MIGAIAWVPSHARKSGIKYRYYLSSTLLQGAPERSGAISRVPAVEIEEVVVRSVREYLKLSEQTDERNLINAHVARVEVQANQLLVKLIPRQDTEGKSTGKMVPLRISWKKIAPTRRREILLPTGSETQHARPIRSETRATLVASIARGRRWLDELTRDPQASADSIAKREGCSPRKVNMTVSLAFLAPDLVKAAIEGRLPHGMGVARLCDMSAEWSRQHQMLGLLDISSRTQSAAEPDLNGEKRSMVLLPSSHGRRETEFWRQRQAPRNAANSAQSPLTETGL